MTGTVAEAMVATLKASAPALQSQLMAARKLASSSPCAGPGDSLDDLFPGSSASLNRE